MSAYLYRAFNRDGDLLYIGSSVQVDGRIRHHYLNAPWWFVASRFTFVRYPDEASARQAEVDAIGSEHPRWNVRHRAWDHPDGPAKTTAAISLRYPQDDRRNTHAHLTTIFDAAHGRTFLRERRAA
jgi:hypothetical protein